MALNRAARDELYFWIIAKHMRRDLKYEGGFLIRVPFLVCDVLSLHWLPETLGGGTAALTGFRFREMVLKPMRRSCEFEDCVGCKGGLHEFH